MVVGKCQRATSTVVTDYRLCGLKDRHNFEANPVSHHFDQLHYGILWRILILLHLSLMALLVPSEFGSVAV